MPTSPKQDASISPPASPQASGGADDQSAPQDPSLKMEFWRAVFESIDGDCKVNFEKLAKFAGYKNASSASKTFSNKRKTSPWIEAGVKSSKTPKIPKAAKTSKTPPKTGTEAGVDEATPKRRGRPPKSQKSEKEKASKQDE